MNFSQLRIPLWVLLISLSIINNVQTVEANKKHPKKTSSSSFSDWQNIYEHNPKKGYTVWEKTESVFSLKNPDLKGKKVAALTSLEIPSTKQGGCLTFSMITGGGPMLEVFIRDKTQALDDLTDKELVWSVIEYNENWHQAAVTVNAKFTKNEAFFIIIKGTLADPKKEYISIKNVVFTKGECEVKEKSFEGIHKCDFEGDGFCHWETSEGAGQWVKSRGIQHEELYGFRKYSRRLGHYASVQIPSDKQEGTESTAELTSRLFETGSSCMRFFYLLDIYPGELTISTQKKDSTQLEKVYTVSGIQGRRWKELLVKLDVDAKYKIVIGFTTTASQAIMAIDDVTIVAGECPGYDLDAGKGKVSCDFDPQTSGCKFTADPYRGQKYEIEDVSGSDNKHIAVHKLDEPQTNLSSLASVLSQTYLTEKKRVCFTFDYNINVTGKAIFYLSTSANYFVGPRWCRMMSTSGGWRTSMVEVDVMNNFRFEFRSSILANSTGSVKVGKYSITNTLCPTTGSYYCTFEKEDWCGWYNEQEDDTTATWTRIGGLESDTTGPWRDKSTYDGTGHYMAFITDNLKEGDKARLTHDFEPKTSAYCLSFWWNVSGKKTTSIVQVTVRPKPASTSTESGETVLWTQKTGVGKALVYGQVEVPAENMKEAFQVSFLAVAGHDSNIAIDELNFEEGPCLRQKGNDQAK